MKSEIGKIKNIKFPNLILDNQDLSEDFWYHWKDLKTHEKEIKCVLIACDKYAQYYMPLNSPYELCKEHNTPSNSSYIVQHGHVENNELQSFLPENYFMPFLDFIKKIPPKNWLTVYLKLIEDDPKQIGTLENLGFWLTDEISEPIKYEHTWKTHDNYVLKCFPFKNLCKRNNAVKYSHYIGYKNDKETYEYLDYNVERLNLEYDEVSFGHILPILRIEKENKK